MCQVVANDEMFARFRFNYDNKTEAKFPLQTLLLRMVVKQVYHPMVTAWFASLEGCSKHHFPFSLLSLCHTIKQKFAIISSNHIFQNQWNSGNPDPTPYIEIKDYVAGQLSRLQQALHIQTLGEWSDPEGAYYQLYAPVQAIQTPVQNTTRRRLNDTSGGTHSASQSRSVR